MIGDLEPDGTAARVRMALGAKPRSAMLEVASQSSSKTRAVAGRPLPEDAGNRPGGAHRLYSAAGSAKQLLNQHRISFRVSDAKKVPWVGQTELTLNDDHNTE